MSEESLRKKTLNGLIWNGIENFGGYGIQFVFGIILARLLTPSEYGIIGMVTVFIAVSNVFINGGFGNALIWKQDKTDTDCSTVFYFNLIISIVFYILIFFAAPYISSFYEMPILSPVLRVMGLNLIFSAFSIVQNALLSSKIDFKTTSKVTLSTNLLSGCVGVVMAFKGYGVWALVFQTLSAGFLRSLFLWILAKWRPIFVFSFASFRTLFAYGSNLLVGGIIDSIYTNLYPILIGKLFSADSLGLYTRANSYASLPSATLSRVIERVAFPVLSKIQNDDDRLLQAYRKLLRMMAFVVFPFCMLLFGVAEPLVKWMITEKWIGCVPMLQLLCFAMMWYPIHSINLILIQVKGRTDLNLRLEIIKKIIGVVIICISFRWGVIGMCVGSIVSSIICLLVNTHYTGRIINLGFIKQIKDILPIFIISSSCGFLSLIITKTCSVSDILQVITGSIAYFSAFIILCKFFQIEELTEVKRTIKHT